LRSSGVPRRSRLPSSPFSASGSLNESSRAIEARRITSLGESSRPRERTRFPGRGGELCSITCVVIARVPAPLSVRSTIRDSSGPVRVRRGDDLPEAASARSCVWSDPVAVAVSGNERDHRPVVLEQAEHGLVRRGRRVRRGRKVRAAEPVVGAALALGHRRQRVVREDEDELVCSFRGQEPSVQPEELRVAEVAVRPSAATESSAMNRSPGFGLNE
jgi:hypothetical protein